MESSNITQVQVIQTLRQKNVNLFTSGDLAKFFEIRSNNTLKHLILRLKKQRIIESLSRGHFLFVNSETRVADFAIANFLVSPSYISLESALSYYGMIDQFPYRITSITIHKSLELKVRGKIFSYSKIKKDLFTGFVKIDDFLIATRGKAVSDYKYFASKGLRPENYA